MFQKKLIFLITIFLIVFGFLLFGFRKTEEIEVRAAPGLKSVWGWAWSSNIGWISLNCLNDYNNDGTRDNHCSGVYFPYEVSIDQSTGALSDYAWSENIVWISFNRAETGVPPKPPFNGSESYVAKLDDVNAEVCDIEGGASNTFLDTQCGGKNDATTPIAHYKQLFGWARFIAACKDNLWDGTKCTGSGAGDKAGGWDGWIKFSKDLSDSGENYGVVLDTFFSPNEFHGWAWGSDVVGWISFNHKNCDASPQPVGCPAIPPAIPDYQVETSLDVNSPPFMLSAEITGEDYCISSLPMIGQVSIKWTYDDDDGDIQEQYHLEVATDPLFNNIILNYTDSSATTTSDIRVVPASVDPLGPREIPYTGAQADRYWRISVQTAGNPNYSAPMPGLSFTIPAHPYPSPDFTWSPLNPSTDRQIQFYTDQDPYKTVCYDTTGTVSCPSSGYTWDFDDGGSGTGTSPTHTYSIVDTYHVTLKATDNEGYFCSNVRPLTISSSLPEWKEIPPFY